MITQTTVKSLFIMLLLALGAVLALGQAGFGEAPMLAARVAAGELPVVDERIPGNPMLVVPVEAAGTYGGEWHMGMIRDQDSDFVLQTIAYESLVRWDTDARRVIPNIAQALEVNEERSAYTFHLRAGMRWSDGEPFTADDIVFWYEGVFANDTLNAAFSTARPGWLPAADQALTVEKLDAQTVVFRFSQPNVLFLQELAHPLGTEITAYPRHYVEALHPDYNPDVEALARERGYEDWQAMWLALVGQPGQPDSDTRCNNPDLPRLSAWLPQTPLASITSSDNTFTAVRNPYYWKIDTSGNQLPYIDQVIFHAVSDGAAVERLALSGVITMQDRYLSRLEQNAAFQTSLRDGLYRTFELISFTGNPQVINFNLTTPDEEKRAIFQNREFRIAMSYAINRYGVIDAVAGGVGDPFQVAPLPLSHFFNASLAYQYIEYNPELANRFLDEVGLDQTDADGFRLGANGERFTIDIVSSDASTEMSASMARVTADWAAVGIDARFIVLPLADYRLLTQQNQQEATVTVGEGGVNPFLDPSDYFPYSMNSSYATAWAYWLLDPQHPLAEEPPLNTQQQMAMWRDVQETTDTDRRNSLMADILTITEEEFYNIGVRTVVPARGIVAASFHNVPAAISSARSYATPGLVNPEQFFVAEPDAVP